MKVQIVQHLDIGSVEIERIFYAVIDHLTRGLFIVRPADVTKGRTGYRRPGLYRTLNMQGHGSDVDELVTENLDDPAYVVVVAALRLEEALKTVKKPLWEPYE